MIALHLKENNKFIGYLHKEYKDTVSVINFKWIKCKPIISRGWRKANIKEYNCAGRLYSFA